MNIDSLRDAKVLVTGGSGFLGQHLCRALDGAKAMTFSAGSDYPLDHHPYADILLNKARPDYVFHLAGYNGGIEFNLNYPADIFVRNTLMGLNLLNACVQAQVKKVVSVVASCAYPAEIMGYDDSLPREVMVEPDFFDGPPHDSVACHGYAKRNLQLASSFYRQQYGLKAVCACPTTLYGPGDSFDPQRTKVMSGMVKRFVDAADEGKQEVVCWGTGSPLREFLYVEDAARLLVETMLAYEDSDAPLNLGSGQEFSIRQVAETVSACVGFTGRITWDESKPDGQHRKRLDLTRMLATLPSPAYTQLDVGVKKTVDYYRNHKRGCYAQ